MADDKDKAEKHPGMMGDGTEEQNLGQKGNPAARITEDEVKEAFEKPADKTEAPKKSPGLRPGGQRRAAGEPARPRHRGPVARGPVRAGPHRRRRAPPPA